MKRILGFIIFLGAVYFPAFVFAAYPFVSTVPNQWIPVNGTSGVINFQVYDDVTPADQLVVTYKSDNTDLIPADDDHVDLEGTGKDRSITITPVEGRSGTGNVILFVTDSGGETNVEVIQVNVQAPPK